MEKAEQWITRSLGDQKIVTFREVARQVGCHVHAAKNHLKTYLETHPDVSATYLISGPLLSTASVERTSLASDAPAPATQSLAHLSATQKLRIVDMDQMSDDERNSEADAEEEREEIELEESGNSIPTIPDGAVQPEEVPKWGVVLAAQDVLEDKIKLFEHACVHIYALSRATVKDPAQLVACAINVREKGTNAAVYGTITGESLVVGTRAQPMRDGGMDFGKKAVKKEPEVKKETKPETKEEPKDVKKEKKDFFKSTAAKQEVKHEVKQDAKKPAPRKSTNKRRIITSDDEDDEPSGGGSGAASGAGSASASRASTPKVAATASSSKLQPTSSMVRAEDQAAMEAMMGMDVDFDEDADTATKPSAATTTTSTSKKTSGGGDAKRKRRRVKKSKVEMDDKGYMVTRDYYTDETCSGSDTETEATKAALTASSSKPATSKPKAPAAAPAPAYGGGASKLKKAPSKPAPMGQSTLAGFFKKK